MTTSVMADLKQKLLTEMKKTNFNINCKLVDGSIGGGGVFDKLCGRFNFLTMNNVVTMLTPEGVSLEIEKDPVTSITDLPKEIIDKIVGLIERQTSEDRFDITRTALTCKYLHEMLNGKIKSINREFFIKMFSEFLRNFYPRWEEEHYLVFNVDLNGKNVAIKLHITRRLNTIELKKYAKKRAEQDRVKGRTNAGNSEYSTDTKDDFNELIITLSWNEKSKDFREFEEEESRGRQGMFGRISEFVFDEIFEKHSLRFTHISYYNTGDYVSFLPIVDMIDTRAMPKKAVEDLSELKKKYAETSEESRYLNKLCELLESYEELLNSGSNDFAYVKDGYPRGELETINENIAKKRYMNAKSLFETWMKNPHVPTSLADIYDRIDAFNVLIDQLKKQNAEAVAALSTEVESFNAKREDAYIKNLLKGAVQMPTGEKIVLAKRSSDAKTIELIKLESSILDLLINNSVVEQASHAGGRRPSKTLEKTTLAGSKTARVVYAGTRGGRYVKIKGRFVSLRRLAKKN